MKKLIPILLIIFFLPSCVEVEPVSPLPEIRFRSFDFDYIYNKELEQNLYTRVLEFDFIDGDADLGVYDEVHSDSTIPLEYRYGVFIYFFEKVDTNYIERVFTTEIDSVVSRDSLKIDTNWIVEYVYDSVLIDTVWEYNVIDTIEVPEYTTSLVEYSVDTLYVDTNYFHQQFPYSDKLDRVGQNKTVKGTVRIGILFPQELPYDTMRLEFYIRDRAMNKSNVEVTTDFANEPSDGIIGIQ